MVQETGIRPEQQGATPHLVIQSSPFSEDFRSQMGPLFSSVEDARDPDNFRFTPLVEWDGVNRLGERVNVQLISTALDKAGMIRTVAVLINEGPKETPIITLDDLKLACSLEHISENEIFVGHRFKFLNWFQTVCKAVEDGVDSTQIRTAAISARVELETLGEKIKVNPYRDNLADYSKQIYDRFYEQLSKTKYRAY